MEKANKINTIICPFCKTENPDISVCLNCGQKIKTEMPNPKEFATRPLFVTILALLSVCGFIRNAFAIYDAKSLSTVPVLIILAGLNGLMAYGLWQLKKWARNVVIINSVLDIVMLWTIPFVIWFVPYEGMKHFFEFLSADISKSPFRLMQISFIREAMYRATVYRAIICSVINVLILSYFYSERIKEMFSDNPRFYIGAS